MGNGSGFACPDEHKTREELIVELDKLRKDLEARKVKEDHELAIAFSEENTRRLLEESFDAVWINVEGKIAYINDAGAKLLGAKSPQELIGMPIMQVIHPDYHQAVKERVRMVCELNKDVPVIEEKFIRLDGSVIDVEVMAVKVYYHGKPGIRTVFRDIGERKRAERVLAEYSSIVSSSVDAIIVLTCDGIITSWNPGAEKIYGYTANEMIGRSPSDLIPPDRSREFKDIMKTVILGGHVDRFDTLRIKRDGSIIHVSITAAPIKDKQGNITGISWTARDITERVKTEDSRRHVIHDLQERVKELKAMYGTAEVFQQQKPIPELLQDVVNILPQAWQYPGITTARITYDGKEYKTRDLKESPWVQSASFVTMDGKTGTIEIFYAIEMPPEIEGPFLAEERSLIDSLAEIMRVYIDRRLVEEALKDSEERFRVLANTSTASIFVYQDDRFIYANPAAEKLSGYSAREMRSMYYWEMIAPDRREEIKELGKKRQRGIAVPLRYETKILAKDGNEKWVDVSASSFTYKGKPTVIITTIDITGRIQMEKAIVDSKKQAEFYLDLITHDINNMNQIAIGFLEAVLDSFKLSGEERQFIERPLETLRNSTRLIDHVNKLQKLSAGSLKFQNTDLCEVLTQVISDFSHIPGRNVIINFTCIPQCYIVANELIKDVFSNIIGNSIKHSDPEKPLIIDIGLEPAKEGGSDYYRVVVEDNGPGIPDELKGKLFDRDIRGPTKASGQGLGLFLVRTLVGDFHGKIWIEDRVHGDHTKGARFVVMLSSAE